jgi:hypothetical protein
LSTRWGTGERRAEGVRGHDHVTGRVRGPLRQGFQANAVQFFRDTIVVLSLLGRGLPPIRNPPYRGETPRPQRTTYCETRGSHSEESDGQEDRVGQPALGERPLVICPIFLDSGGGAVIVEGLGGRTHYLSPLPWGRPRIRLTTPFLNLAFPGLHRAGRRRLPPERALNRGRIARRTEDRP